MKFPFRFLFVVSLIFTIANQGFSKDVYRIEVVSKRVKGETLDTIHGEAHFPHPPEVVYKLLQDYSGYHDFFPLMKESTIVTPPDQVRFRFDSRFPFPEFWSLVQFKEGKLSSENQFQWSFLKGNVKENSGKVKILPEGASGKLTLLSLDFKFDPGTLYPKSTVTKITIPYVREALLSMGQHAARMHQIENIRKRPAPTEK